jgi:hypothetical protein
MDMVDHVANSIEAARAGRSKIDRSVLALPGFSSPRNRHLLNNLCNFDGCNYLEVGSWKGSTVISAAFKNSGHFTAIESFKKFWQAKSPKAELLTHKKKFRATAPFTFHETDAWQFDISLLPPGVNVYFYDGDHRPGPTKRAFTHFDASLADTFILVMDDWNRDGIRDATHAAIRGAYDVLYECELFTPGRECEKKGSAKSWWNGLYVAVLRKARR